MQLGGRVVHEPVLAGGGLAQEDGAGGAQPDDLGAVDVGNVVLEDERRLGERPARHALQLLDADGHAAERQRDVGALRGSASCVGVQVGEGVELRVVDGGERSIEGFER